jgi:hypothetical protein
MNVSPADEAGAGVSSNPSGLEIPLSGRNEDDEGSAGWPKVSPDNAIPVFAESINDVKSLFHCRRGRLRGGDREFSPSERGNKSILGVKGFHEAADDRALKGSSAVFGC